nr:glycosyltransferase family 4 protein [Propionivibrio soli]
MFAGNMGDAQDFPAILDAAEILKDKKNIRWLVVGDGRATEWVRSEVDKRRLGQSFLLLGRYPIERMPSFYKHADALLVSLKESPIFAMTIPGKLQSYLASGLPILAMLNGEGAQIISSSGAGLSCRAGDGNALAAAVIQLAEMPVDARKKMGARGLALSRTEFDRETLITRLEHWFAEMANKDRRAGAR